MAVEVMTTLNRGARDAALAAGSRAATDVTGFGLLGHLHHLLLGSGCAARIRAESVPWLPFVRALADEGLVPGGTKRNLDYVSPHTAWDGVEDTAKLLLCDAQTSGGLLLAVASDAVGTLLEALESEGAPARVVIGEIVDGPPGHIEVIDG